MRTAVALGSNLGDRLGNLRAARNAILLLPGVMPPVLCSPVYETDPVDCEPGAPKFLNAVLEFDYEGAPVSLLRNLRQIEQALGRSPDHPRNVSRAIDIDLLYCGTAKIATEELQLPHPRICERRFVLQPLSDIRPGLTLPGQIKTIAELLEELKTPGRACRFTGNW